METTLRRKSGDIRVSAEELFLELNVVILQSGLLWTTNPPLEWHFSVSTMAGRSLRAGLRFLPRIQPLYGTSRAHCWLSMTPAVPRVARLSIRHGVAW